MALIWCSTNSQHLSKHWLHGDPMFCLIFSVKAVCGAAEHRQSLGCVQIAQWDSELSPLNGNSSSYIHWLWNWYNWGECTLYKCDHGIVIGEMKMANYIEISLSSHIKNYENILKLVPHDLLIITQNGTQFKAHKIVLCRTSNYFVHYFMNETKKDDGSIYKQECKVYFADNAIVSSQIKMAIFRCSCQEDDGLWIRGPMWHWTRRFDGTFGTSLDLTVSL